MGVFVVRTSDGVTWPLDANQLYYLIDQGWIKESVVSAQIILKRGDIDDRNKQNTLVRVFSIAQILWFLISCAARLYQRLPLTTLELTTVGFIVTTVGVAILWFNNQPAGIETQQIIELEVSVSDLHEKERLTSSYYWYDTPLDFLDPEKPYFGVASQYCLDIVFEIFMSRRAHSRPITRSATTTFQQYH